MHKLSANMQLGSFAEIRGVEAGQFNPDIWASNTLHWVFNNPAPLLEPQDGKWRNIYAPSIIREKDGWRVFYGAWDGVESGNDRIYSRWTTDFCSFTDRRLLIDHGVFIHVCNCSAVRLQDGSYYLMATAFPDSHGQNKPASFRSPDAIAWNGKSPHQAQLSDIIAIVGYDDYTNADINGMNVVFYEDGVFRLYFSDFKKFGTVWRASSKDGRTFTVDGTALSAPHMANDVKKFVLNGRTTYLMALHGNRDKLWFSLSNDGLHFNEEREITCNQNDQDRFIVAVGWVSDEDTVYGVLYGAGAVGSLDRNRIFAKWLQKRVVFQAGDAILASEEVADGPDRVRLKVPAQGAMGYFEVFAEDGRTSLYRSPEVEIKPGDVWQIPSL